MFGLRRLPAVEGLIDGDKLEFRQAVEIGFVGEFRLERSIIIPGDDFLRDRRIEEFEIGLRCGARSLGVGIAVDQRHRRLREDGQRWRDDVELVLAELLRHEERFVLPGNQHVAKTTLRERDSRAARAGVEHGRVAIDGADEILDLVFISVEFLGGIRPSREVVPARAP